VNFTELKRILAEGTKEELDNFISDNDLHIENGKVLHKNTKTVDYNIEYWNTMQSVKKLSLNALYGALLNKHCRFSDKRIGQSTTLTGRSISRHMDAHINECLTGEYKYDGKSIVYGDSVVGESLISVENSSSIEISTLFDKIGLTKSLDNGKEYAIPSASSENPRVLGFSIEKNIAEYGEIAYVMRHKVSKQLYKLTMEDGSSVTVTEDHSIMIERSNILQEIPPTELLPNDLVISIIKFINTKKQKIIKIEKIASSDAQYVYDISMKGKDPYFFANGHLVHNTDSCYFSAWPFIEANVKNGELAWDVETAIALYDHLADEVNDSFAPFMKRAHNCPVEFGELIKCGREVVASSGLFITKKRYALMVVDKEGKRMDIKGKPGKIKAMGLDLKRSDTPPIVQAFLSDILNTTLTTVDKDTVIAQILAFKKTFSALPSWEKGSPKRINNVTKYTRLEKEAKESGKKANLPGHARAGINYNTIRRMNKDKHSIEITDGIKSIVCKLKDNQYGFTSIAIPTDENNIPDWFKELPFDDSGMEESIVTKKIDNLIGVLEWDYKDSTNTRNNFAKLFKF